MVKHIILSLVIVSGVFSLDVYERNCVECHKELPMSLQKMFKRYLLVYSGEQNVKAGLKHYLKYPLKEISVMDDLFIDNYGIKKKTTLKESDIDEALDIYWDKFKVFNKLK
ncbi:hypothetical protein [Sulfurovum sp.]|uniref:hypothetical protein n=1 Tax=Sulfurovum sp. TaxID=1969726 RepID=UPI002868190E|nr:hypothetical protein [Sulfurovum sp.]